jgi:galactonate dehydratase
VEQILALPVRLSMMRSSDATISQIEAFQVPVSAKTTWIILSVRLGDGTIGYGEATRFGAEEAVLAEVEQARRLLEGKAHAIPGEALAAFRMAHASEARLSVTMALEQALFDAIARHSGMPLSVLLGGPERRAVPVYANINRGIADRSPAGFAAQARAVVTEDGYRAVKIAPFDGLDWSRCDTAAASRLLGAGIDRIQAVREAIGPDRLLLVDCHWRLSPVMARTVLRETESCRLFWFEDPLREDAFDAATARSLRGFANDRGIRVAGGEAVSSLSEARDLIDRGGYDAFLPDLRWTGIRSGLSILELAAASGIEASLHNPVGPVLDLVSIQVAASLPSFLILERQVRETPLFDEIRGAGAVLEEGAVVPPLEPGFGAPPSRQALERAACNTPARSATFAGMAGAGRDA